MNKLLSHFLLPLLFISLCISCAHKIQHGGGSGQRPTFITSYYKGEDSLLYFVREVEFKSAEKNEIVMDYTYLYSSKGIDKVTCNFTVFNQQKKYTVNQVNLTLDSVEKSIDKNAVERFYSEPRKKAFAHRYSFSIPEKTFYHFIHSSDPVITINEERFTPRRKRKWKKKSKWMQNGLMLNYSNKN